MNIKMFGKNIVLDDVIDSLDRPIPHIVLLEDSRNQDFALSEDMDKAGNDKADKAWKDKAALGERKTVICEEFWNDFILLSKVCMLRNSEADLYDVFETIRTKFLGGWGYTESYLAKLDAEIEKEESVKCLSTLNLV